jgi:hypothetical protein
MRSIYVPLPDGVADKLRQLARRELRDPKEQAAWLILDGLRRAGLDSEARPTVEQATAAPGEKR